MNMEERSTTPRASQTTQSRRFNNRSRTGSEEIKQIFAQHASKPNRGVFSTPMSASSSASGLSNSVTPVPQHDQAISQPGLLSWMRNALLPGSSPNRSNTASLPIDQGQNQYQIASLPYVTVLHDSDPLDRQDTPLLPGIVPAFHRQGAEIAQRRQTSTRTSLSQEGGAGGWSLEPLHHVSRRPSAVSAVSTAEDDDGSSNSSDEDVYTPFTANEEFAPPLINCSVENDIQPTRYNSNLRNRGEDCAINAATLSTKREESSEALRLASKPRLNLTIGQGEFQFDPLLCGAAPIGTIFPNNCNVLCLPLIS